MYIINDDGVPSIARARGKLIARAVLVCGEGITHWLGSHHSSSVPDLIGFTPFIDFVTAGRRWLLLC
jgi:hypothetical protein